MNSLISHLEMREHRITQVRHPIQTVSVINTDGRIFESRQFSNPARANWWAASWGLPLRLMDGYPA